MGEPAAGVSGGQRLQGGGDSGVACLARPGAGAAEDRLELTEGLLDGIEIRRVGWQEEDVTARGLDQTLGGGALMNAEVVPDDELAGTQRGHQDLGDEDVKCQPVEGSLPRHGGGDPPPRERRDQRGLGPVIARGGADHPLAPWRPTEAGRHCQVDATLIDEDEVGRGACPALLRDAMSRRSKHALRDQLEPF